MIQNKYTGCVTTLSSSNECKMYTSMGYKLKYGDGSASVQGTTVRSGREKTFSDTENLYPSLYKNGNPEDPLYKGLDYKAIYELLTEIGPSRHFTMVFNTFLWMTIFNFINARKL